MSVNYVKPSENACAFSDHLLNYYKFLSHCTRKFARIWMNCKRIVLLAFKKSLLLRILRIPLNSKCLKYFLKFLVF